MEGEGFEGVGDWGINPSEFQLLKNLFLSRYLNSQAHMQHLLRYILVCYVFVSASVGGIFAQTPASYPYFNRIHIASDSTHPSFYHFYAGGEKISEDTILILGQQFLFGNEQIYQRTFEFIDANTGDLIEKKIEPNSITMGIENPFFCSGFVGNNFYDLGTLPGGLRTLRKYSNVHQVPTSDYPLDAYPTISEHDWYKGFTVQKNNNFVCYGSTPNGKTLFSIFDTSGVLFNSTNLSHLLPHIQNNFGEINNVQELHNESLLISIFRLTGTNTWTGQVLLLNEDLSWKKRLFYTSQKLTASIIQAADSSLYCFGNIDTSIVFGNPNFISYVSKFDQDGNLLWNKYYPTSQMLPQDPYRPLGSVLLKATEFKSGNLLLIGNDIFKGADGDYQQMDGEQSFQTRLLCINPDGDKIWERSFHTSADNSSLALGFIPLANDDIIIYGGIMEDFFFYQKAFVAKVNCLGRMTDLMHDVQLNEQDGLVSVQIEADSFFETTIDWGDSTTTTSFQTSYADSSELFFAQHVYPQSKNYHITVSTRGCKDTLVYNIIQEAHVPDNNEAALSMFPNPTLGFFQIKIPTNELLNLEVTDEFGKIVYQNKDVSLFNGFEIDLSLQPVGMYHIRITGKARNWIGKVVKI